MQWMILVFGLVWNPETAVIDVESLQWVATDEPCHEMVEALNAEFLDTYAVCFALPSSINERSLPAIPDLTQL